MARRRRISIPRPNISTLETSLSACLAVASATFCLAGLSVTAARTTWPEWTGAMVIGLSFAIGLIQIAQRRC
jgi:formate/nitrite transporter FocA (FNT family)